MKILWIDDEIELLKPFIYFLKEKGYEVKEVSNGVDGLNKIKEENFDLVFLDEMMPGIDGLEVAKKIKNYDPNISVVMVTKVSEETFIDEAYANLVDDFILKPLNPMQILAVIKRLLEKKEIFKKSLVREYLKILSSIKNFEKFEEWCDFYQQLIKWREYIYRFSLTDLKESYEDILKEGNENFVHFIEANYFDWLKKNSGPILSHRFFDKFIKSNLDKLPLYWIIFDSLRLDQWLIIYNILKEYFLIKQDFYCSILPSATPYSRNALLSGLTPEKIFRYYPHCWVFEDVGQNRYEEELFQRLLMREKISLKYFYLKVLKIQDLNEKLNYLLNPEAEIIIIVINFLDFLIHSAKETEFIKEIAENEDTLLEFTKIWFNSSLIFQFLKRLKQKRSKIIITSDHGFIKVKRPTIIQGGRELSPNLRYKSGGGLTVDKKAAWLLAPKDLEIPQEFLGEQYAICKSDYYFIYPTKPKEYEKTYKFTYQHGGISMQEMILPVGILFPLD
ncbi:MAG: bifunctional response regulator/alkaline phosphatase family protein [candidate division WOR-3 bacterium]|nr:bifunctional response regulator/alkaline phosphatase family protein [candidate division WOR-3 bacterium]MCX7836358.1 bifunctional response regulator/alkaline phosphatase family protein [candidate division WOR-3 bacterium]MDW8113537.1 bifunctional response regulator/alkaline phosphatase family protein [candidate division WOR-3 bacterium]